MTVLELSFPASRYHATPWGRHVNEGAVEWPPSPWRVLRALVATWHLKLKEIPESTVRSLVEKLSVPPRFWLPRASTSHTRHYMPYNEGKNEKTTKVFDTFIQLEEGSAILVTWDTDLAGDERVALKRLAECLGYFGRAESLVVARTLDSVPVNVSETHSISEPLSEFESLPTKTDLIRLLAPTSPTTFAQWRDDFLTKALTALGPKPTAAQKKKLPQLPEHLFAALHADTGDLQAAGWNLPPGAQFVNYTRHEDAFAPATRPRSTRNGPLPTVARFAVTSVVQPSITRALAVGEQIHTVLCEKSDGHPVFTGTGSEGHSHAHIFCESEGSGNAHITHVTVFAPKGFDEDAIKALKRLGWTWGFNYHELRLVLHAIGTKEDFKDCRLFAMANKWRSLTPFVSTRHAKTYKNGRPKLAANGKQLDSAEHDLMRLLEEHHPEKFAELTSIAPCMENDLPYAIGHRRFRSLQFQTHRRRGEGSRGNGSGNAFEITFAKPVTGPLALGYAAHYGLGLFVPV